MPQRLPKTRPQLADLLAQKITDALNRQNTAEAVRLLFEEWAFSGYNRAEDSLPADRITGLPELIAQAIPLGNDAKQPVKCVYAVARTSSNTGKAVRDGLKPETLCIGALCYASNPGIGEPAISQLVADAAGSLQVWPDGRYVGVKVPARWDPLETGGGGGLTPEQAEQLAAAGSAVKVTGPPDFIAGFASLAEAEQQMDVISGGLIEDYSFVVQRDTVVDTPVNLSTVMELTGTGVVRVNPGGVLNVSTKRTSGLSITSANGTTNLYGLIHNCTLFGCTVPGNSANPVTLTDTRGLSLIVQGTLVLGPGATLDLDQERSINGSLTPVYADNGDGTYTSIDGGTVIDQRGGGGGSAYTLPAASPTTRGGMKVGDGLTAAGDVVSVAARNIEDVSAAKMTAVVDAISASLAAQPPGPAYVLDSAASVTSDPAANTYRGKDFVDTRNPEAPYWYACRGVVDSISGVTADTWFRTRIQ